MLLLRNIWNILDKMLHIKEYINFRINFVHVHELLCFNYKHFIFRNHTHKNSPFTWVWRLDFRYCFFCWINYITYLLIIYLECTSFCFLWQKMLNVKFHFSNAVSWVFDCERVVQFSWNLQPLLHAKLPSRTIFYLNFFFLKHESCQ